MGLGGESSVPSLRFPCPGEHRRASRGIPKGRQSPLPTHGHLMCVKMSSSLQGMRNPHLLTFSGGGGSRSAPANQVKDENQNLKKKKGRAMAEKDSWGAQSVAAAEREDACWRRMCENSSYSRPADQTGRTGRRRAYRAHREEKRCKHATVSVVQNGASKSLSLRGDHRAPQICYEASWESPCGSSKYIRSFQRLEKLLQSRTSGRPSRCTLKRRNRNSKEEEGSKREQ